ncbi:MAG: HAMP domain-containing sensor histidine kinase [Cyclobacteriaceae bacterium]
MKNSKNTLALVLIVSSIILLLALQVFWLTNSYEKAYFDLRRETDGMFRSTIMTLRDSMLVKSFEKLPSDSAWKEAFRFSHKVDGDTVNKSKIRYQQNSSQIQIYISSDQKRDSLQAFLRPLTTRIQEGKMSGGNFILRLGPDSLSSDSIRHYYRKSLAQAEIDVPFEVKHSSFIPTPIQLGKGNKTMLKPPVEESLDVQVEARVFSNSLHSDWVRFDPVHRYAVVLSDFRPLLIKAITPQILFSLFLTLLTTAAFVIMYRSIRTHQRLMELKNDFISNITHELKTPVTTVGVAIEALKNFKGLNNPELTTEYLDIAQNELNRLNILTDKILKTAIFENKGVKFNPEPVDMEKLVEQVLGSMKLVFEKQGAHVHVEKEGQDFQLMGGPVHLTSVIYNLLDNALKYSSVDPTIIIKLKSEGNRITLSIKDQGIGIAQEHRKKVFEKFFRVPTGDVHNIKGYGLGLSYVETVVRSHKGTIEVESEPGKGSNFIITLPK